MTQYIYTFLFNLLTYSLRDNVAMFVLYTLVAIFLRNTALQFQLPVDKWVM